jgi:hypothetical protein
VAGPAREKRPAPARVLRRAGLGVLLCLLVLGGNVAVVSARLGLLHRARRVQETDHRHYIEMARGREGLAELAQAPPYCFRVAIPALARGLSRAGLGLDPAFFLLTNLALFGFLFTLWLYLGDLGFALPLRVTGLLLLGLTQGAVRWFEYQYWMTDPAGLFLVALAFLLIRRDRRVALGAVSLVAAFVRETYVLVYPYDVLHQLRRGVALPRALGRTAAVAVLPAAVLVGLRWLIVPNQPDDFAASVADSLGFRWRHLGDNQLYVLTLGAFGVLVPLLLLLPSRLLRLVRDHFDQAAALALVYATLVISNNTERPLAYALPVVLPAALWCLREFLRATGLPAAPVLAACVALQALFYSQQRWGGLGDSIYQPTSVVVAAAMAGAYAAARVLAHHPRTEGKSSGR